MCFSFEASAIAFLIDFVGALILYKYNTTDKYLSNDNKIFAYVLLGLSTMQVGEALIHLDIKCSNNVNAYGSHIAFFSLLVLQPVYSGLGTILYGNASQPYSGLRLCRFFCKNKNWLKYGWMVIFTAYIFLSANVGYEQETFYSNALQQNVSKWCTSDFYCEGFGCPLLWNWDDLNQTDIGYFLYFFAVLGFPILALEYWEFWLFIISAFFIIVAITWEPLFRLGAACLWGPPLSMLLQLTGLPLLFRNLLKSMNLCNFGENNNKNSVNVKDKNDENVNSNQLLKYNDSISF